MAVRYCCVNGCFNTSRENHSFYHLPLDEKRKRLWIRAIGRPELASKRSNYHSVCDIHFLKTDRLKKKLKPSAVPSLMLPNTDANEKCTQTEPNVLNILQSQTDLKKCLCNTSSSPTCPSVESQCNHSIKSTTSQDTQDLTTNTPRKTKLQSKQNIKCKRRKTMECEEVNMARKKYSLEPQLKRIRTISSRGNTYNEDFKMFALNLYFASPLAYRVLRKSLCLPSQSTLKINISTRLTPNVQKCLEFCFKKLNDSQKYCIICADEVSLKTNLYYKINKDNIVGFHEIDEIRIAEPATRAFVLIARGLLSDWQQPLGYCFLSQSNHYAELDRWVSEMIAKMLQIGFHVVAFTSDQGSHFIRMANNKSVSFEQPFFYVNDVKIYYIFDVSHLIKSVRNNLMKYDIVFEDSDGDVQATQLTASWEDILALYNFDKNRAYRLAPKLTTSHISPNIFEKNNVKLATQVFSKTVAAALNICIELQKHHSKSIGTVKFIELMNDMFNILNSSSVKEDYKCKNAFSQKDYRLQTLNKVLTTVTNIRFVRPGDLKDVTTQIKCLNSLKITIKSVLSLSDDLKSKGFDFFLTRRLSQEVLENLFGCIRRKGGNCRAPTPIQFSAAFKKHFFVHLVKNADLGKCSEDLDSLLLRMDEIEKTSVESENSSDHITLHSEPGENPLRIETVDYRFELPEENALIYVCGYLLRKCHEVHNECEDMNNYLKNQEPGTAYNLKTYSSLIVPQDFVQFIKEMDDIFRMQFQDTLNNVGHNIIQKFSDIKFNFPCRCFPIEYLRKLFVRFRIFSTIRFNNRNFKKTRRKCFSVFNL